MHMHMHMGVVKGLTQFGHLKLSDMVLNYL